MRVVVTVALALLTTAVSRGQESGKRHGVEPDLKSYPQATAKEALASVLKAAEAGRFDYLAAQLADPEFIDDQVIRLYGGRFAEQVEATRTQLTPATLKLLKKFLEEGELRPEKGQTTITHKDVKDRVVRLKQVGDRWYLEHRSKP
jgi:hypothetical protein